MGIREVKGRRGAWFDGEPDLFKMAFRRISKVIEENKKQNRKTTSEDLNKATEGIYDEWRMLSEGDRN